MSLETKRGWIDPEALVSIAGQCELLDLPRSSWYYQPVGESEENLLLMRLIDEQFTRTPYYGSRKMAEWLRTKGFLVNRKRACRLMQVMGLEPIYAKPRTTIADAEHEKYPYLLRNVVVVRPNQVWSTDITYIRLRHGFVYLVAVIDWYSRFVLSWQLSKRRPSPYRRRRERKPAFGMMLQIDASPHDWLQGRGRWLTLVGAIDDATNFRWARFVEAETTWSYLDLLYQVASSHGLPLSLYSDRHTIFFSPREPTIEEELRGIGPLTQFGRAMDALGIRIIPAYSPQAKGRVERMWGCLQDRLVVELRLAKAHTIDEANAVLERFLARYNARFRVAPAQSCAVFRRAPAASKLERILWLKELRIVSNDHTVSFEGLVLQIPPSKSFRSIARRKVDVLQLRDGSTEIVYRGRCVARFCPSAVARMVRAKPHMATNLKAA